MNNNNDIDDRPVMNVVNDLLNDIDTQDTAAPALAEPDSETSDLESD